MRTEGLQHVEIEDHGRLLATADVEPAEDGSAAMASVHVEPGPLPGGTRERLVDAVLDAAHVRDGARLHVGVPRGDAEILDVMRESFDDVEVRPAGASVIVDAHTKGASTRT